MSQYSINGKYGSYKVVHDDNIDNSVHKAGLLIVEYILLC